jgi:hypothetical protein
VRQSGSHLSFRVKELPATVMTDAQRNNLHAAVLEQSTERVKQFA